MYNIIPLAIILLALAVIIYIILRRLSHVSTIDTSTIPAEMIQKTKTKILDERLKRKFSGLGKKLGSMFGGVSRKVGGRLEETKGRLESMKKDMEKAPVEMKPEPVQAAPVKEKFEDAEQRFIDVISHDPKNTDAYLGLADLYLENMKYPEAIETFRYLHKLMPDSASISAKLSQAEDLQKQAGEL